MNNYIKLMTVLLVSHQITNAMMVVKPKATSIKTPSVNLRVPSPAPYVHQVEGQNDSYSQPGLVPLAPPLSEDDVQPLATKSALAQAMLLSHDKKNSNEIQSPSATTPIVVKVIPQASCEVPTTLLSPKDQKSAIEVRVVAPAIEGAQAAAVEGPLAPMASSLTAAATVGTQQTSEKEKVITLAPCYFNGQVDDFSQRIRTSAQQRVEGDLLLGSKLYKQYQEKIKKKYPTMPEFIINYVMGKTYDSDKKFLWCNERHYLLDLCDVGFPYLNSENLWVTILKNDSPDLHDIDARVYASSMIKSAIMFEVGKKVREIPQYSPKETRREKLRMEAYYKTMIELWKDAQKSENPADKRILNIQVPLGGLIDPKKEDDSCSLM